MARDPSTDTDNVNTVTEQVKSGAQQAAQQAQDTAGQVASQAQQQATSLMESQKGRASGTLSDTAKALQQTGQQLQGQGQSPAGQYIERAGQQVDRLAQYLDTHDVNQIVGEVERFARREPAVFLGGAFIIGFMASRFLKSSPPPAPYTGGTYGGQHYGGQYSVQPQYRYDDVSGVPPVQYGYGQGTAASDTYSSPSSPSYAGSGSSFGAGANEDYTGRYGGSAGAFNQGLSAADESYSTGITSSTEATQPLPDLPNEEQVDTARDVGI